MPLSQAGFDYLRTLVCQRTAIVLDADKTYLAEARLLPLARRAGYGSVGDLLDHLPGAPANGLQQQVVEAMTINETSFFRDHYPFEALRQVVLPQLLQRRAAEKCLNVWCAACSSGQEPYSVALLLREHFSLPADWHVRLIASDVSDEMLERARQARYSRMEVNRGLPARLLVKYFVQEGSDWLLREDVRRAVEFRRLNLAEAWPALPALDIILLRNVLIYFNVPTKKAILGKVRRLLRPDGFLFLGGAETTLNLDDAFERVPLDRAGCYRRASATR